MSASFRYIEWLGHIIEQVDRIHRYLGSPPDTARLEEPLVGDAVERCLSRISEAASRFDRAGVDLASQEPAINWRAIRNFGNWLRHEYDNLDGDLLSNSVNLLPDLRAAALRLQAHFDPDQPVDRPMA